MVTAVLNSQHQKVSLDKYIDTHIKSDDPAIRRCFAFTTIVNLEVEKKLTLPNSGWTNITRQTEKGKHNVSSHP